MAALKSLISWQAVLIVGIIGVGGLFGLILILNEVAPIDNPNEPNITPPSTPDVPSNTTPQESNTIGVYAVGVFTYNPAEISTVRPDIFNPGYFSIFDILVHLSNKSEFNMSYHFDETMNSNAIDSINGVENWWYEAWYSGGWREDNIFRMDHFPVKDDMTIVVFQTTKEELNTKYQEFREEINRKQSHNGSVIIPRVIIIGKTLNNSHDFYNVTVSSHNLRNDVFVNGTITAIDIIISLADQGEIAYTLKWYEQIGRAKVVKNYWVEAINQDRARGFCGFVYETGPEGFRSQNHIHIPSDIRVINSPEYAYWFWIELGSCGP